MVKLKICGITRIEDARLVAEVGADYLGVILYPKSPRFVPKEKRRELIRSVSGVKKVAVMVNPSLEEALEVLKEGFDLIQLHGEESLDFAKRIGLERIIKAFRVGDKSVDIPEGWKEAHGILLDTYVKGAYGGTGKTFNWDIAEGLAERGFRIFLAGGLNPDNVEEAIKRVKPYAVDVSSGVEKSPGVKDEAKVRDFAKKVLSFR